jgi:hypothetical protein
VPVTSTTALVAETDAPGAHLKELPCSVHVDDPANAMNAGTDAARVTVFVKLVLRTVIVDDDAVRKLINGDVTTAVDVVNIHDSIIVTPELALFI